MYWSLHAKMEDTEPTSMCATYVYSFIIHSVNPYKVDKPIGYRICRFAPDGVQTVTIYLVANMAMLTKINVLIFAYHNCQRAKKKKKSGGIVSNSSRHLSTRTPIVLVPRVTTIAALSVRNTVPSSEAIFPRINTSSTTRGRQQQVFRNSSVFVTDHGTDIQTQSLACLKIVKKFSGFRVTVHSQ
jgi:hypothetical protein